MNLFCVISCSLWPMMGLHFVLFSVFRGHIIVAPSSKLLAPSSHPRATKGKAGVEYISECGHDRNQQKAPEVFRYPQF